MQHGTKISSAWRELAIHKVFAGGDSGVKRKTNNMQIQVHAHQGKGRKHFKNK